MSDIDRYQYGYDSDSNRLWKANSTTTGLDEFYTYDPLNRLTKMQRGVLNGTNTGITGTPAREMDYTLDQLGNWNPYVTKTSGSTDLNQTRTHNTVNEITAIGGTPAWATPPGYDDAGNMTSFPQPDDPTTTPYTAVYDAWNRLVQVSDGSNLVAQYQYDGQNWRTVKKTYAGSSILLSTRHYYYSSNWQDLEERVDTSTSANFQYVWGVRYIDELVCRDYANTPGSSSSSSSSGSPMPSSPSRLYAFQDANFNLTGVCDAGGTVRERYAYDPYGNRMVYDASWSPLATSDYAWVIGHQGLMIDIETGLVYNRNRMLHPQVGRFMSRDPIGYVDGLNLYQYEASDPVDRIDQYGLIAPVIGIGKKTPPCCTSAQTSRDQAGYSDCIQAVDADIGQQEQQLDANYANLKAQIAAAKAGCLARCYAQCASAKNAFYRNSCIFACDVACGTAFADALAEAYVAYEAALAALGVQQQAAYAHCWSLFPCAVPESSGGDPYNHYHYTVPTY